MRFAAPMIASTGQASMHNVQPMQRASVIVATSSGPCLPHSGASGCTGKPASFARRAITASPPGGQRLMAASCPAIASA